MLQFCRGEVLSPGLANRPAGICWNGPIWPGSLIQAAVLSFTSGSPAFLALIFVSYFCIPFGIMKNIWLLFCSTLRSRATCWVCPKPFIGETLILYPQCFGLQATPLGPLLVSWDTSPLLDDHLSWHLLSLEPTGLRLGSGGGRAGWVWGATADHILSCILSSKNIEKGKQMETIIHTFIQISTSWALLCVKESWYLRMWLTSESTMSLHTVMVSFMYPLD